MNYKEILEFLFNQLQMFQRVGATAYKANLDNTIEICNLLNNPQQHFKTIHIAGTNGKGSVSHFIASALQEAGYKTGLFTSPHLKDFRERIKVNNKKISKKFVKSFVNQHLDDFLRIEPSFFEMTVGLAFDYFASEKIDVAVIETGLGGRLDSTNIISPELSVITNIAFDHTNLLGNTLTAIANEKAGIIKKNIPVIIGETQNEIKSVFENKAKSENAELIYADSAFRLIDYEMPSQKNRNAQVIIEDVSAKITHKFSCPLIGLYQKKNLITAVCALKKLKQSGFHISDAHITSGISNVVKNTGLMGRWQLLSKKPLTICDTGHNVAGITEIVAQLKLLKYKKLHLVLGMVNDKDISTILNLLPKNAIYYFCSPNIPRGLDAFVLSENARQLGLKGKVCTSVKNALEEARSHAKNDDIIFVGGSTFVVAEVV